MTTATLNSPSIKSQIRAIREGSSSNLSEFDDEAVRNTLIQSSAHELSMVAESARESLNEQTAAIDQSTSDFDTIIGRMSHMVDCAHSVQAAVNEVVTDSTKTSAELETVNSRMKSLEEQFGAIDRLVNTINKIADQSRLLALNATIEAARAGEMGKGFGVVAHEVKELAANTKEVNEKVRGALNQINTALRDLSTSVGASVEVVRQTIATVNVARDKAATIESETSQFNDQLQISLQSFHKLSESSAKMGNELTEVDVIGETFNCLSRLITARGAMDTEIDPLDRLAPLVNESTYFNATRFTGHDAEYQLTSDDILISATDTKGIITFANNRFYEVAGYDAGELVGRPHNVIRHPDMPKTAFADLWAVIQAGKTWQGYVKNRAKHGGSYWVKANVFPCFDNGQIVGYISVRTKPSRERISQAIDAYRRLP
ncbi:MAG: methyl-accepting chemotaxis protein [Pirellulales bacterium]